MTTVIYIFAGVLWGCFAGFMQNKIHREAGLLKMVLVILTNTFLWPVCMALAVFNLASGRHDKYFIDT
jgi:hypothetical protein